MNSKHHSNPSEIDLVADSNEIRSLIRTSNTHDFPSPSQSLTSIRAARNDFANHVFDREKRILALLGIEYGQLNAIRVEPNLANNHEIVQKLMTGQSGHPLFGRVLSHQNTALLHAASLLSLNLRNQSQLDANLVPSTAQFHPLYQEALDPTENKSDDKISSTRRLPSNPSERQKIDDAPCTNTLNSLMSPTSDVLHQKLGSSLLHVQHLQQHDMDPQKNDFPPPRATKGRPTAFPKKLYQMLLSLEMEPGGSAIASFLPHGRAFAIHKPQEFVRDVIPQYFDMSSYASFRRQLKMYNFEQSRKGPEKGSFYHELFVRGQPHLFAGIKRVSTKKCT